VWDSSDEENTFSERRHPQTLTLALQQPTGRCPHKLPILLSNVSIRNKGKLVQVHSCVPKSARTHRWMRTKRPCVVAIFRVIPERRGWQRTDRKDGLWYEITLILRLVVGTSRIETSIISETSVSCYALALFPKVLASFQYI
jgi:hypothetical protein